MSAPDAINFYGFQLQITNNGVDNTQLAFSSSQNFGYVSNASLNPAYVFLGDSLAAQSVPPFIGIPTQTVYPNDTFIGADATNSTNPVLLSAGTTYSSGDSIGHRFDPSAADDGRLVHDQPGAALRKRFDQQQYEYRFR